MCAVAIENRSQLRRIAKCFERGTHIGDGVLIRVIGQIFAVIFFRETDDAKRYRRPGGHGEGAVRPSFHPGQLRRAAANIEDQRRLRFRVDEIGATGDSEARFFFRRNDGKREAGFAGHAVKKFFAVCSPAASLRRNTPLMSNAALLHFLRTDIKRSNCPVHSGF